MEEGLCTGGVILPGAQEVLGVPGDHRGADLCDVEFHRPAVTNGLVHNRVTVGDQAVVRQGPAVVGLALRHGAAGLHDVVLLDVHHGVHLHQPVGALQGHEVGRLVRDVQQQGEGGLIAHLLDLAFGGGLGRRLCGAGDGVEVGLLGPLVGQDEADVGLVRGDRGDAGVHIHVVADGDIVVPLGSQGHVPLAEHGVEEAVVVHAVVVVLLHDEFGVVHMVYPAGDIFIVSALAGDGVHQHSPLDVRAAEEADGLDHPGADPVGAALLVDLKHRVREHIGGVVEPQVAHEVPAEVLGGGVLHALVQPDHLRLLGHHVDDHVGGQAVGPVGEPLDQVSVGQGGHPHRAALIVDLGV